MDLEAYRRDAEAFMTALTREFYRHYAGLQAEYDIEPIYARHAALFTAEAVSRLREQRERSPAGSEARRRLAMLLAFAVDGFVGERTKSSESALAEREAALEVELDGEKLGFREVPGRQANEADRERRHLLERRRLEVLEAALGALYREHIEGQHAAARELGWVSYAAMCGDVQELDLAALAGQTSAFLAATSAAYPERVEPHLERTLGYGLSQLGRGDLPRFFRAPDQDALFPGARLVDTLVATLAGLGIDAGNQPGLMLDVDHRPGKSPRAFCAPVRTPGEVYLVIAPIGGRDDYAALFHEGGHAQHSVHVDPAMPFEYRYLGDYAVTETYAFLLQHLLAEEPWLAEHLEGSEPSQLAAFDRAVRLFYLRRYAAKLAYELELHGADGHTGAAAAARYGELLGGALGIEWPSESYLADVDPGFYSAAYLRAWAFESQLRAHLRARFGERWFAEPAAGDIMRGLWREGQRRRPEELLGELTGEELGFDSLRAELAGR